MADSANAEESKRATKSRPNTREERLKQQKEWKKRKRARKRAKNTVTAHEQEGNDNDTRNDNRKPSSSPPKPSYFTTTKHPSKACSRGALMLQMARGADVHLAAKQPKPPRQAASVHRNPRQVVLKKERVVIGTEVKELNPEYMEYLSEEAVGSGSYGECYRARYRASIEVIVKKMKHDDTAEGKQRAKRNLLHEAKVVRALGDHARLPLLLGVVTLSEPLCLVTQFHGVKDASLTLHRAANTSMLTPQDSTDIFLEICSALKHVHSRGYLHNDIKANNVVLEKNSTAPEKYSPVLIDFGKSTKAAASSVSLSSSRKRIASEHLKSYLAPEVMKDRLYSAASDVYSIGKMLKNVSKMVGFYPRVRALVKEVTAEIPSLRPCLDDFNKRLASVKF